MSMDFRDYYATLGVSKTATEKEIKQAYRRLARKHHPDVNPGDRSAETRFKELNEAYEVLGTPETRKKYDELGANWRQYEQAGQPPGGGPWGPQAGQGGFRSMTPEEMESMFGAGGSPFSDFFNTFFGGGGDAPAGGRGRRPGPGTRQRRAPDVEYDIPLDLASTLGGHVERVPRRAPHGDVGGRLDGTHRRAVDRPHCDERARPGGPGRVVPLRRGVGGARLRPVAGAVVEGDRRGGAAEPL